MKSQIIEKIQLAGIIPVIKLEDAKKAAPLGKALCEGGLLSAEVTFRTKTASESIRCMKEACPDMLVGAGTVLTKEQVDEAAAAGAEFIVSPGFNPEIVEYCAHKDIIMIPGCSSPSDVEQAIKYGLEVVKFFPAEAMGGLPVIKAMAAPYGEIRFMPTGGINISNVNEYLNYDRIIACGGTWMVKEEDIDKGDFEGIRTAAEEAMRTILGFKLAHIGINCEDTKEAHGVADSFAALFGFMPKENPGSIFSDTYVEAMKSPFLGKKGHIAIAVNSVERAKAYMQRRGAGFREDSVVYREDGKMQAIYMQNEVGGFAIHLVRNPDIK